MTRRTWRRFGTAVALLAAVSMLGGALAPPPTAAQQPVTLKMQASWPASLTLFDNFKMFADRVDKLSGGRLKIEPMPAGAIVPAFEVLDATNKKVIDGAHTWAAYWVGKNKTAVLFTGGPGGTFGMDFIDVIGWYYEGGGLELYQQFYKDILKLNVVPIPILPSGPQACGIDCAEWIGGVEDLKLGFHTVWKYHYTPGMHENVTIGEVLINGDVWKGLAPDLQEIIRSAAMETLVRWWARWQRQNADAIKELQEKHKVQILRTPDDILIAFLKAWDKIAAQEAEKDPFFKKTLESQRKYASVVVPAKRFMFPAYDFAANYYWPPKK